MPTTQVQFRRGTAAQNNSFTGASGEITVDTTNNTLRVHDGVTAGGYTVPTLVAATGNLNVTGGISATGNITGNYFLGNGSLLSGIITSVANINNGTSNVTVTSSGGNITVGIGGTSNVAVFATTGLFVTGNLSVSNVSVTTRSTAMSLIYGG